MAKALTYWDFAIHQDCIDGTWTALHEDGGVAFHAGTRPELEAAIDGFHDDERETHSDNIGLARHYASCARPSGF